MFRGLLSSPLGGGGECDYNGNGESGERAGLGGRRQGATGVCTHRTRIDGTMLANDEASESRGQRLRLLMLYDTGTSGVEGARGNVKLAAVSRERVLALDAPHSSCLTQPSPYPIRHTANLFLVSCAAIIRGVYCHTNLSKALSPAVASRLGTGCRVELRPSPRPLKQSGRQCGTGGCSRAAWNQHSTCSLCTSDF